MTTKYDIAEDPNFQAKVRYEYVKAALAVSFEADTVDCYAERQALCGRILHGKISTYQLAMGVAANQAIADHIAAGTDYDATIAGAVSANFTAYAKNFPAE